MKKILALTSVLLLAASLSYAQSSTTGNTTLNLTVGPEAAIVVGSTGAFTAGGSGSFANYATSTSFTYYIRTSSGGSGSILLQVTSDFAPTGGPSVKTPPTSGDALTYTCSVQTPGTACTGTQTASTTSTTPVATFGAGVTSAKGGNPTNSVSWALTNDPVYAQGSYAATVTFTIAAT